MLGVIVEVLLKFFYNFMLHIYYYTTIGRIAGNWPIGLKLLHNLGFINFYFVGCDEGLEVSVEGLH